MAKTASRREAVKQMIATMDCDYANFRICTLLWSNDDTGANDDAEVMKNFCDYVQIEHKIFVLNHKNTSWKLQCIFADEFFGERFDKSLILIHYPGHGVSTPEGLLIGSDGENNQVLWTVVEDLCYWPVHWKTVDIVVLLDCCDAGESHRGSLGKSVTVISGCQPGQSALKSTQGITFTRRFLGECRNFIRTNNFISFDDVFKTVLRNAPRNRTPAIQHRKGGSICYGLKLKNKANSVPASQPLGMVLLSIHLEDQDKDVAEILNLLSSFRSLARYKFEFEAKWTCRSSLVILRSWVCNVECLRQFGKVTILAEDVEGHGLFGSELQLFLATGSKSATASSPRKASPQKDPVPKSGYEPFSPSSLPRGPTTYANESSDSGHKNRSGSPKKLSSNTDAIRAKKDRK